MLLEVCADRVNDNEAMRLCKLPHLLWQLLMLMMLMPWWLNLLLLLLLN